MALKPLFPTVKHQLMPDWDLLATEAGRTGRGLRASIHVLNGEPKACCSVAFGYAPDEEHFAEVVRNLCGIDEAATKTVLPKLFYAIEETLRQMAKAHGNDDPPRRRITFEDPTPWSEAVDGAALLRTLEAIVERFVVMPKGGAYAVALWIMHTYTLEAASVSPILHVTSPQPRCGKSTLLLVLLTLCRRAILASSISPASVFRVVDKWCPALLIDEVDTFINSNDELRGILNSGHSRWTAEVVRCDKESLEVESFSTWGAKALSGIGDVPPTLHDRSITISLRRRLKEEAIEPFRLDQLSQFGEMKEQCLRWAQDNIDAIQGADPELPEHLDDRAADNWRELCSIATVAGEDSMARARKSIAALTAGSDTADEEERIMLLSDMRDLFRESEHGRIHSENLAKALADIEDRPWPEYGVKEKPISKTQIAKLLKPFGIRSQQVRVEEKTAKGYKIEECQDSFFRYLTPLETKQAKHSSNDAGNRDFSKGNNAENVSDEKSQKTASTQDCFGCFVSEGGDQEKKKNTSGSAEPSPLHGSKGTPDTQGATAGVEEGTL